jgi:hypothetical protein
LGTVPTIWIWRQEFGYSTKNLDLAPRIWIWHQDFGYGTKNLDVAPMFLEYLWTAGLPGLKKTRFMSISLLGQPNHPLDLKTYLPQIKLKLFLGRGKGEVTPIRLEH